MRCSFHRTGAWLWKSGLSVAFPPHCALCERELEDLELLCDGCRSALPSLPEPRCARCGDLLTDPSLDLCLRCGTQLCVVETVVSLGPYSGSWGRLVRLLKYEGEIAIGRWLGQRLAARVSEEVDRIDAVAFVPMTRNEQRVRGFNQAQVLAQNVARHLDVPLARLLTKVRMTHLQSRLPALARQDNVDLAFRSRPSMRRPRHVLLVDDVFTTGATVESCARALVQGGSTSVTAATVARS